MLYYFVKLWSWLYFPFFFSRIEINGKKKIPREGAIIFTPNHQGAFMDAVVVGTFTKKPVSFLTRADIFKKAALPFLRGLNMMPIYRIRDGIQSLAQNDEVFETCYRLLRENKKHLLIFPEGNHSANFYLRPLSKGTARLALGAREALDPGMKLYIVPAGINYFSHRRRAKLSLTFGDPIDVSDYLPLYQENNQKAFARLKSDLTEAMKSVMILPDKDEQYEARKRFVFRKKHENLSFHEMKKIAEADPEEVDEEQKGAFTKFLVSFFSMINFPPLAIMKKILSGVKDKAFYISLKCFAGFVLFVLWWLIVFVIGTLSVSWEFGALLVTGCILFLYARQALIGYVN